MLNLTHMFRSETAVLAATLQRAVVEEDQRKRQEAETAARKAAGSKLSNAKRYAEADKARDKHRATILAYLAQYGMERTCKLREECDIKSRETMRHLMRSLEERGHLKPFPGDKIGPGMQPRFTLTPAGKRWLAAFQPQEQA